MLYSCPNSHFILVTIMVLEMTPKLIKVLMKLGQEGKGVYWDLIEMLYEESGYLSLAECESYAFALRTNVVCLKSLIEDFGLFQNDGENFWSDSVLIRLAKRLDKSNKAKASAYKRWNTESTNANALPTHYEGNAINKSKGKDIKIKKISSNLDSVEVPSPSPSPSKNSLENRKIAFKNLMTPYATRYSSEMLNSFYQYWVEKNATGVNMRFEMEKVFDIGRRLGTWFKNEVKFSNYGKEDKLAINRGKDIPTKNSYRKL